MTPDMLAAFQKLADNDMRMTTMELSEFADIKSLLNVVIALLPFSV